MRKLLRKPSPAMILACLALFVASTGTSIAAGHYLITSTKQIKPSVLTKLKGAKGPAGAKGATGAIGATGATGATGAAGKNGATSILTYYSTGVASYYYSYATATCPTGTTATGGGVYWTGSGLDILPWVVVSAPSANTAGVPTAWYGEIYVPSSGYATAYVYVNCASP